MAINIPIITSLEDKGIKAAQAAFSNFKTSVAGAEGGMNKFKAGAGAALDSVKANAAAFAVAAAGSIIAFAKASVTAFQDLALSAGKFADASGLAVEDASRYIEAAGDIGVPVEALETANGRLNRTIGADPDKVRNLGVDDGDGRRLNYFTCRCRLRRPHFDEEVQEGPAAEGSRRAFGRRSRRSW